MLELVTKEIKNLINVGPIVRRRIRFATEFLKFTILVFEIFPAGAQIFCLGFLGLVARNPNPRKPNPTIIVLAPTDLNKYHITALLSHTQYRQIKDSNTNNEIGGVP